MVKRRLTYTVEEIFKTARSLFESDGEHENYEYNRGVCELIGRLQLDVGCIGEGTYENAVIAAGILGVRMSREAEQTREAELSFAEWKAQLRWTSINRDHLGWLYGYSLTPREADLLLLARHFMNLDR